MHITALLSKFSQNTHDYALHIYKHRDEIASSAEVTPPVVDIAIWGIETEEWFAVLQCCKLNLINYKHIPRLFFSDCETWI